MANKQSSCFRLRGAHESREGVFEPAAAEGAVFASTEGRADV